MGSRRANTSGSASGMNLANPKTKTEMARLLKSTSQEDTVRAQSTGKKLTQAFNAINKPATARQRDAINQALGVTARSAQITAAKNLLNSPYLSPSERSTLANAVIAAARSGAQASAKTRLDTILKRTASTERSRSDVGLNNTALRQAQRTQGLGGTTRSTPTQQVNRGSRTTRNAPERIPNRRRRTRGGG